jgi:mono/diheme cytochrome c family protein
MKQAFAFVLMGVFTLVTACSTAAGPASGATTMPEVSASATLAPLPTLAPEAIAVGQKVYAEHCAECHGTKLEGEANWKTQNEDKSFRAPPHTTDGHTWHHPDGQLLEAVQRGGARFEALNLGGTSNMPAYEEILTDGEITAVLTFIKSFWPDDIRAIQWQQTLQSQAAAIGQ